MAIIGLAIASYLSILHGQDKVPQCFGGSDSCSTVAASVYSDFGPIRISTLGIIGYAALTIIALFRGFHARAVGFSMALCAFGFSVYLTYLELYVIHAICQWCVASAVVATALLIVHGVWFRQEFLIEEQNI